MADPRILYPVVLNDGEGYTTVPRDPQRVIVYAPSLSGGCVYPKYIQNVVTGEKKFITYPEGTA